MQSAFTVVFRTYARSCEATIFGQGNTVRVNEEIIRRYVKHQDEKDQEIEQQMELCRINSNIAPF